MKIRAETSSDAAAIDTGIRAAFESGEDDVFMARELEPGAWSDEAGKMYYHRAFDTR